MSDIKLFDYGRGKAEKLSSRNAPIEKWLQNLIEANMETFLGVRFLATEYPTGKTHRGRIDSLGLDENNCPVIVEYKRRQDENVMNQGLFYLDWLLDHKAELQLLVMDKLGKQAAEGIDWENPRLLCVAGDFTRYDEHAVQQNNHNIELIRYHLFGENLLMLELVNAAEQAKPTKPTASTPGPAKAKTKSEGHQHNLKKASPKLMELYDETCSHLLSLGDEVRQKDLKWYTAFKKIKNFACILAKIGKPDPFLYMWLKVDPDSVKLEKGFTRDVRATGHLGTGDLEVRLRTLADLEKAKPLIEESYRNS